MISLAEAKTRDGIRNRPGASRMNNTHDEEKK